MADKVLSQDEQKDLSEKFEMVENEIGGDVHHRFEQLAKELEERIGAHRARSETEGYATGAC